MRLCSKAVARSSGGEELVAISDGTGRRLQVSAGGLRNELPLTAAQEAEAIAYSQRLGMREDASYFVLGAGPSKFSGGRVCARTYGC